MKTGQDLIAAIVANQKLMGISDCPAVPVAFGEAFYGSVQNDDNGVTFINDANLAKSIQKAVGVSGSNSETAVWNFVMTPKHHLVVVPWYQQQNPHGQVYTIFMAYENAYDVGFYVGGTPTAPPVGGKGYKESWSVLEISTMLAELLTLPNAWTEYFGQVGANQATSITYYKYKTTSLDSAVANVNSYQ